MSEVNLYSKLYLVILICYVMSSQYKIQVIVMDKIIMFFVSQAKKGKKGGKKGGKGKKKKK